MFRYWVWEERPEEGYRDTACHRRQSIRSEEIDGIVRLSVGGRYLLSDLADLKFISNDHRGGDDGDDTNNPETEHFDRYIESARHEYKEEHNRPCCMHSGNVPGQETNHHANYSADDPEHESKDALS